LDVVMTATRGPALVTDTRRDRDAVSRGRPPPGTLVVSVERRGAVVALELSGELDMATAPRVGEAMAWLRASTRPRTTIVIDTTGVDFIAAAGYRALRAALVGPNGVWDARVALIVGPVVARLEAAITAASRRRRVDQSEPVGRRPSLPGSSPSRRRLV
jgi:anti-anti-sigma factor